MGSEPPHCIVPALPSWQVRVSERCSPFSALHKTDHQTWGSRNEPFCPPVYFHIATSHAIPMPLPYCTRRFAVTPRGSAEPGHPGGRSSRAPSRLESREGLEVIRQVSYSWSRKINNPSCSNFLAGLVWRQRSTELAVVSSYGTSCGGTASEISECIRYYLEEGMCQLTARLETIETIVSWAIIITISCLFEN